MWNQIMKLLLMAEVVPVASDTRVRGSNPVIIKFFTISCFKRCIEKSENYEKAVRNGPFKNTFPLLLKSIIVSNFPFRLRIAVGVNEP